MKNVDNNQLKKCIFAELPSFEEDVKKALGEDIEVLCNYEGISFKQGEEYLEINDVMLKLSQFYDVDVLSIHIDDYDEAGVWIEYAD